MSQATSEHSYQSITGYIGGVMTSSATPFKSSKVRSFCATHIRQWLSIIMATALKLSWIYWVICGSNLNIANIKQADIF